MAVIEQSKTNCIKAKAILDLYDKKKTRISEITHSQYVINIIDTLFAHPFLILPILLRILKYQKQVL